MPIFVTIEQKKLFVKIIRCYRRLAEAYGITFVKTTKFRFRRDISADSLHTKPERIRQLAARARFSNVIKKIVDTEIFLFQNVLKN